MRTVDRVHSADVRFDPWTAQHQSEEPTPEQRNDDGRADGIPAVRLWKMELRRRRALRETIRMGRDLFMKRTITHAGAPPKPVVALDPTTFAVVLRFKSQLEAGEAMRRVGQSIYQTTTAMRRAKAKGIVWKGYIWRDAA